MVALLSSFVIAKLFAQSGASFITQCPSRLSIRLPHSSPRGIRQHMHLRASSASDNNQDQDEDEDEGNFAAFLETQERRNVILGTAMFQKADVVIIESIVQLMEKLQVQKDQRLFQQGQTSDVNMYIVASGTFECIDEVTGKVEKVLKTSDLFGELALEFGTE